MARALAGLVVLSSLVASSPAWAADDGRPPLFVQSMTLGFGAGARFQQGGPLSAGPTTSDTFGFNIRLDELFGVHHSVARQPFRVGGFVDARVGETGTFAYSTGASFAAPVVGALNNYLGVNFSVGVVGLQNAGGVGGVARLGFGFHHIRAEHGFDYSWGLFTEARHIATSASASPVTDVIGGVSIDFPSILLEGVGRLSH